MDPADAHAVSWHGMLHIVTMEIGFLAVVAACFVLASPFDAFREREWATYSQVTGVGVIVFSAFAVVATGSGQFWSVIGFWIGVLRAWARITVMAGRLLAARAAA